MKIEKKLEKRKKVHEAFHLYHNKGLSNLEIAKILNISARTVCRWKKEINPTKSPDHHLKKITRKRQRKYPEEIFTQMLALKKELQQRSATNIWLRLKEKYPDHCPCESTIRKYLVSQGCVFKEMHNRLGYIKFQRSKPNDLWQIDIAGVQTVAHLGRLYLIAILDDCSRYVVAAEYFTDQSGVNVLKIIRDAVMKYGRPNQIVADNGTQFRNVIKDYENRYTNLLHILDIKSIYAKPHHPQTKGKLERWFGTVIQSFLGEARLKVKGSPELELFEFNRMFHSWLKWYNESKPHRSLPKHAVPSDIYLHSPDRFFRPLEALVDWNQWINAFNLRKVNKYNEISYKTQRIQLPPGYMGSQVGLLDMGNSIEIFHQDQLIMTHTPTVNRYLPTNRPIYRKIAQNGTIQYQGHWISIDYKMAGKKVEVKENAERTVLLIYLDQVLIKQYKLKI